MNTNQFIDQCIDVIAGISIVLSLVAGAYLLFFIVTHAVRKQETNECITWEKQSHRYPNFTVTSWQQKQCARYGFDL